MIRFVEKPVAENKFTRKRVDSRIRRLSLLSSWSKPLLPISNNKVRVKVSVIFDSGQMQLVILT